MSNPDSILKSWDITLPVKGHLVKAMTFPIVMYGCESWTIKKVECWRINAFELWCWCWESLGLQEIKPVNPKGNQSWIFIGRTDAEAEVPILLPLDEKSWLIGKDPDASKDRRQEEKGMTEDGMVGWHHLLNGNEYEQVPGGGDGQGGLSFCNPWGSQRVRYDWATEQLQHLLCTSEVQGTLSYKANYFLLHLIMSPQRIFKILL